MKVTLKSIVGSPEYWFRLKKSLEQAFIQLGFPTLFGTFSHADLYEKVLEDSLFTTESVYENVGINSYATAQIFKLRVELIIKHFFEDVLKAQYHFFRIEFQHRGSSHVHFFIKTKEPYMSC